MPQHYVLVQCERASTDGLQVLLVLKDKPLWQRNRLNLIGGKIEPNEEPIDCAVRELKEETGLDAGSISYQGKMLAEDGIEIHCFFASLDDPHAEINPRDGETEQVAWYTLSDVILDKRLIPNLRVIIPLIHADSPKWIISDLPFSGESSTHTFSVTVPTYRS